MEKNWSFPFVRQPRLETKEKSFASHPGKRKARNFSSPLLFMVIVLSPWCLRFARSYFALDAFMTRTLNLIVFNEWWVDCRWKKSRKKKVLALLMQGWEMTQISYFIKLSQLIEFVYRLLKCQTLHLTSVTRPLQVSLPFSAFAAIKCEQCSTQV